jgi:hypothetical protein
VSDRGASSPRGGRKQRGRRGQGPSSTWPTSSVQAPPPKVLTTSANRTATTWGLSGVQSVNPRGRFVLRHASPRSPKTQGHLIMQPALGSSPRGAEAPVLFTTPGSKSPL